MMNHWIVLFILLFVVFWSTCSSCSRFNLIDVIKKLLNSSEGFQTLDSTTTQEYADDYYSIKTAPVDPKKWSTMNGQGKSQFNHLDKNAKLIFANTPFKPECCPNTYSNSQGCACMSTQQYNTLITRGGNNIPFSQY